MKSYLFASVIALPVTLAAQSSGAPANGIAAIVNDEIITVGEVSKRSRHELEQIRRNVRGPERRAQEQDLMRFWLEVLIRRRLIAQEANRLLDKNPETKKKLKEAVRRELDRQSKTIKPGDDAADDAAGRITWQERSASIREGMVVDLYLRSVVYSKVSVSPADMHDYYQRNLARFQRPKRVKIRRILIEYRRYKTKDESLEAAQGVMARVRAGEDFVTLVKSCSHGLRAQAQEPAKAGLFGFDEVESLRGIRDKALALSKGEVSDIIADEKGFVIIKAEDVQAAREMSFEEAQRGIRKVLAAKGKEAETKDLLDRLEAKSVVTRLMGK